MIVASALAAGMYQVAMLDPERLASVVVTAFKSLGGGPTMRVAGAMSELPTHHVTIPRTTIARQLKLAARRPILRQLIDCIFSKCAPRLEPRRPCDQHDPS